MDGCCRAEAGAGAMVAMRWRRRLWYCRSNIPTTRPKMPTPTPTPSHGHSVSPLLEVDVDVVVTEPTEKDPSAGSSFKPTRPLRILCAAAANTGVAKVVTVIETAS